MKGKLKKTIDTGSTEFWTVYLLARAIWLLSRMCRAAVRLLLGAMEKTILSVVIVLSLFIALYGRGIQTQSGITA